MARLLQSSYLANALLGEAGEAEVVEGEGWGAVEDKLGDQLAGYGPRAKP